MSGVPPHGSLGPSQGVTLTTALTHLPRASAQAVVIYRSGPRIHAWDAGGRHKSWRLNKWALRKPGSNATITRRFYPDARGIDQLTWVGYTVEG
jgi:hypothetical protein